jgi:hypothetical protein
MIRPAIRLIVVAALLSVCAAVSHAATLTGKRKIMISPNPLAITDIALGVGGDQHEHLGQLIAHARMNHIVPPWSK